MVKTIDKMDCFDEQYPSVLDYYREQVRIASRDLTGKNSVLVIDDEQIRDIAKAALTTGDAGAVNAIYSLDTYLQVASQPTIVGILQQWPWRVQGYRACTALIGAAGSIGVAEGGALAAAGENTYAEVAPVPAELELVSDFSQRLAVMSKIADAISPDRNRQDVEKGFWMALEKDLLDEETNVVGNDVETLDRICGALIEETHALIDAGDSDLYGLDRTAATWADANVDDASGVDRDLTIPLIEALRRDQENYWEGVFPEQKAYATGQTTWTRWGQLEATKQRYAMDYYTINVGQGIKAMGQKGGFKLASWDGVPIVKSPSMNVDTIDRILLLDLRNVGLAVGRPIAYNESDDMFAVGHVIRGAWYGIAQTYCTNFKAQGKLRDLK